MMSALTLLLSGLRRFTSYCIPLQRIAVCGLFALGLTHCGSGGSDQEDPLAEDEPVAYVKRPVPTEDNGDIISDDILQPTTFNGGAALYIIDRASQTARERNITNAAFGTGAEYDVKDVEVSYDGRKLLFSMRGPQIENADEEDQPKWRIWEYNLDTNSLRRVFGGNLGTDITGQYHDISPAYLPDGRIVFASTRQVGSTAQQLEPGGPGFSYKYTVDIGNADAEVFNLHVYDPVNDTNGEFIQQITFGHSHELQPTVLQDGRIAFLRSERAEGRDKLSIYTVNIDGSNMQILYGYHSQTTGNSNNIETTFIDLRELSDGSLSAILQSRESATLGGDIIQINSGGFTDINQPTTQNAGDSGTGQRSLTLGTVNLEGNISTHGYFNSAYPIDGRQRFLVSWNPCRLSDNNNTPDDNSDDIILACTSENLADTTLEPAPPFYGLWIYDTNAGTQTPVSTADEGQMFTDAVIMEPKTFPQIAEGELDTDLEDNNLAILNIRSVYDISDDEAPVTDIYTLADPTITRAADRPARFLRLVKTVGRPSDPDDFGLSEVRGMRQIIGYTPIEPDGSVRVTVPADVAFNFDIVDANGESNGPLHRNTLYLRAGETYNCVGCHTSTSTQPHGRVNAETSAYRGTLDPTGTHFTGTRYTGVTGVEMGDTMAEVYALVTGSERNPTSDLLYTDDWSNTIPPADPPMSLRYSNMPTGAISPVSDVNECQTTWSSSCTATINYPDHIQPLWELSRPDGGTCILCHTSAENTREPDGQLELTRQIPDPDNNIYMKSYTELLTQDDIPIIFEDGIATPLTLLVLDGGSYQYEDGTPIIANGQAIPTAREYDPGNDNVEDIYVRSYETGRDGGDVYLDNSVSPPVEILDALVDGQPIPLLRGIRPEEIPADTPVMRLNRENNAANSSFFQFMTDDDDHSSLMSLDELRLIREWLDIGGQYYNSP